ncbi:zinc ribbon domain-containing protein [Pseudochryseolinea flava]|uniref:Zinc-ribbon domain-containing protein n=1 Tax=Pseudochryseolinea flava TaxID=2059302 RepID=A0A364XZN1_9BACT|nr:hypothetical protein DQQ10_15650 [Pseudochryseolinea flava]
MKKKECPSCAMQIDENASTCPICGYLFPKTSVVWKILAIILIILMLYHVITL